MTTEELSYWVAFAASAVWFLVGYWFRHLSAPSRPDWL